MSETGQDAQGGEETSGYQGLGSGHSLSAQGQLEEMLGGVGSGSVS